jgi:hypothetical protein
VGVPASAPRVIEVAPLLRLSNRYLDPEDEWYANRLRSLCLPQHGSVECGRVVRRRYLNDDLTIRQEIVQCEVELQ